MLTDEARLAKNKQTAETLKATRLKRQSQTCRVYTLKITTNKLTKQQAENLKMVFVEAKWLRNHILSTNNISGYKLHNEVIVKNKDGEFEIRELKHLGTHLKQAVKTELEQNKKALKASKDKGRKIGALKYTSQVNSINLKEAGRTYQVRGDHVQIQKLGWMRVKGAEQLDGWELANAKLIQKPDGYYLAVTCYKNKELVPDPHTEGTAIGIDMGLKTHIACSNGTEYNVLIEEPEHLKRLQRKLYRQVNGSNSYYKTRSQLQRAYQKLSNKKNDAANKIVHDLLLNETVFLQDENLSAWRKRDGFVRGGRTIQHSVLGRVKAKLVAHPRAFVLRKNAATTQSCVCCARNKHQLVQRTYFCSSCGYRAPRDVHAAMNMVWLGQEYASFVPVGRRDFKPVERMSDFSNNLGLFVGRSAVKPEAATSSVSR